MHAKEELRAAVMRAQKLLCSCGRGVELDDTLANRALPLCGALELGELRRGRRIRSVETAGGADDGGEALHLGIVGDHLTRLAEAWRNRIDRVAYRFDVKRRADARLEQSVAADAFEQLAP